MNPAEGRRLNGAESAGRVLPRQVSEQHRAVVKGPTQRAGTQLRPGEA